MPEAVEVSIGDLSTATTFTENDLLLVEQSGVAYNTRYSDFVRALQGVFQGLGSISSITLDPSQTQIVDGAQVDTYVISYTGSQQTASFTVTNGKKGDRGAKGAAASLSGSSVQYAAHTSGTTAPSSGWVPNPPTVAAGQYLWTKITLNFNSGSPVVFYSVAKQGSGIASNNTPLGDDYSGDGSAGTSTNFSRSDHRHPSQMFRISGTVDADNLTLTDSRISTNTWLLDVKFGSPNNVGSDVSWTTSNNTLSFSGTVFSAATTVDAFLVNA